MPRSFAGSLLSCIVSTIGFAASLTPLATTATAVASTAPMSAVAGLPGGVVLVVDTDAGTGRSGALFQVDPTSGARTVLSDFGAASQGPLGADPYGVAIAADQTVLVSDRNAGTNGRGAVFRVNPSTGARTLLSDFGSGLQGPLGVDPSGLVLEASGQILVVDPEGGQNGNGALYRVDAADGSRTMLTDFGTTTAFMYLWYGGGDPGNPTGLALRSDGIVLVADPGDPVWQGLGSGVVFGVDPTTGQVSVVTNISEDTAYGKDPIGVLEGRGGETLILDDNGPGFATRGILSADLQSAAPGQFDPHPVVLSDFADVRDGPLGVDPTGITRDFAGRLLIADPEAGTGQGLLFAVDERTGIRTVVSDFGDPAQGPPGVNPIGVAADLRATPAGLGDLVLTTADNGTNSRGALYAVDSTTGARTILSNFGNVAQGPLGADPKDVAYEATGQLLVVDYDSVGRSGGWLFRVDPTSGQRTVVSDFHDPTQGEQLRRPNSVAVERSGQILVLDDAGGLLVRVDPITGIRTRVSSFTDASQGPTIISPSRIAVEGDGTILATDLNSSTSSFQTGMLLAVDPASGQRTIVSDFGARAQSTDPADDKQGGVPAGLIVEPTGNVLVSMFATRLGLDPAHRLLRVDRASGIRFVVVPAGSVDRRGIDVAFDRLGQAVLLETGRMPGIPGVGGLLRIDPATGAATVISDFSNAAQGQPTRLPTGVAVVGEVEIPPAPFPSTSPFRAPLCGGPTTNDPTEPLFGPNSLADVWGDRLTAYNQGRVVPLYSHTGINGPAVPQCTVRYVPAAGGPVSEWTYCTDRESLTCAWTDAGGGLELPNRNDPLNAWSHLPSHPRLTTRREKLISYLVQYGHSYVGVGKYDLGVTEATSRRGVGERAALQYLVWCISDPAAPQTPGGRDQNWFAFCQANLDAAEQRRILDLVTDNPVLTVHRAAIAGRAYGRVRFSLSTNIYSQPIKVRAVGGAVTLRVCGGHARLAAGMLRIPNPGAGLVANVMLCARSTTSGKVVLSAVAKPTSLRQVHWNQSLGNPDPFNPNLEVPCQVFATFEAASAYTVSATTAAPVRQTLPPAR